MTEQELVKHSKHQEKQMREVLVNMADMITLIDVPRANGVPTSYYIDYDEQDVFNAILIFYSVASNYAIKHGHLTYKNVTKKISKFCAMIKNTFGIDTMQEGDVKIMMQKVQNCLGGND